MKKIVLLLVIILIIFSCSVNNNTGLIIINNLTYSDLSNIKIGDTLITSYISSGYKYDYYYFNTLSGELTGTGIYNKYDVEFRINHVYNIDIVIKDDKIAFNLGLGKKMNEEEDSDDFLHDPVQ